MTDKIILSTYGYNSSEAVARRRQHLRDSMKGKTATEKTNLAKEQTELAEKGGYAVAFDVTPDINESATAMYGEVSDIRAPASILIYSGSPSRTFQINAKLLSRTDVEAARTERSINRLRSWRMPESLKGGAALAIPTILNLSGYGDTFKFIPVVMTSLSIDWSSEFDSVRADGTGSAIPIITPVSISLREVRNQDGDITGLDSFDIDMFRAGILKHW